MLPSFRLICFCFCFSAFLPPHPLMHPLILLTTVSLYLSFSALFLPVLSQPPFLPSSHLLTSPPYLPLSLLLLSVCLSLVLFLSSFFNSFPTSFSLSFLYCPTPLSLLISPYLLFSSSGHLCSPLPPIFFSYILSSSAFTNSISILHFLPLYFPLSPLLLEEH